MENKAEPPIRKVKVENDILLQLMEYRYAQNLTISEVAERIGIDEVELHRIEKYESDPYMGFIRRYALAVGVLIKYDVKQNVKENNE